jgi:hypothetical protein
MKANPTTTRVAASASSEGENALALAPTLPYVYGEARLLPVYGRLHAKQGQPEQARERLEAALAIFRRLGAQKDSARRAGNRQPGVKHWAGIGAI